MFQSIVDVLWCYLTIQRGNVIFAEDFSFEIFRRYYARFDFQNDILLINVIGVFGNFIVFYFIPEISFSLILQLQTGISGITPKTGPVTKRP